MSLRHNGKKILLLVTGMSPQIVTETVYALCVNEEQKFIPDQIFLITTTHGASNAELDLLAEDTNWFGRLLAEYNLPPIRFTEKEILIITDKQGNKLDDIRTPQQNEAAADFITETVRMLTADASNQLHVSIAGGRKTMGYYLGYALSLFGRRQDSLSHVLVSAPYESHPQFFYPTKERKVIHVANDKNRPLDCNKAKVELAYIPFVRLREGLHKDILNNNGSFSKTVKEAQQALPDIELKIDVAEQTITASGINISISASQFAIYWMLAERAKNAERPLHHTSDNYSEIYSSYYKQLVGEYSGRYMAFENDKQKTCSDEATRTKVSKINGAIKKQLSKNMRDHYLVHSEAIGIGSYKGYLLHLKPEQIQIQNGNVARKDK